MFLNKIYNQSEAKLIYKWDINKIIYKITINSYYRPKIEISYKIDEYNISPQFDYIEPAAKSPVLFDYSKNVNQQKS